VFQNPEVNDPEFPDDGLHSRWDFVYEPFGPLTKGEFERRRKISESLKRWWTPERRFIHAVNMRQIVWQRKWKRGMNAMYAAAIEQAQENHWEYTQITLFWSRKYREFWKAHDDSGDWEIIGGQVVRTKVYGKPCPPRTGNARWELTAEDHWLIGLMSRYSDWDYQIGWS